MAYTVFRSCIRALSLSAFLFAGIAATTPALAAPGQPEASEPVIVTIDRARIVRIPRPADTIVIGNPAIADATIQDAQTIVLTGRSFGITNIVVLGLDGDPIVDETIVVQGHEQNTVRIYRQSIRETLACAPICEPTLTVGDDNGAFVNTLNQVTTRNQLSERSTGN